MAVFGEAIRVESGVSNPGRVEAERIFAANPPLSREQAAELLKTRGVNPPGEDGTPTYTIPPTTEAQYPPDAPIAPAEFVKMALPPMLATVVAADLAKNAKVDVDPEKIEATYKHSGRSYAADTASAQALLDQAGCKTRAAQLPVRTLRHLADWQRHRSPRP